MPILVRFTSWLTRLDLGGMGISEDDLITLGANVLPRCINLKMLSLAGNALSQYTLGCARVVSGLSYAPKLEHLDLSCVLFTPPGAHQFYDDEYKVAAVIDLFAVIGSLASLEELIFKENYMVSKPLLATFAKQITKCENLKMLVMSNSVRDIEVFCLTETFAQMTLKLAVIALGGHHLTTDVCKELCGFLAKTVTLRSIDLHNCAITDAMFEDLAEAVWIVGSGITELCLTDNRLTQKSIPVVATIIAWHPTCYSIDVRYNRVLGDADDCLAHDCLAHDREPEWEIFPCDSLPQEDGLMACEALSGVILAARDYGLVIWISDRRSNGFLVSPVRLVENIGVRRHWGPLSDTGM